ncbi:helix-turn-helix domain-containing protein [Desulfarculus baarsii]|uniref:helix-turn-helix domain-containing protein n=1 Tax=Desulfarculus baarsii TaxID=453230 RepID=UPI0016514A8A|nr:helix-turn-helix transcriptional regulator [Desulfarculus baarsii]
MLSTDDIWAELKRRRITAKAIAANLGVSTSTVTRTINGDTRTPSPSIIAEVSRLIGVGPEFLRPGRSPEQKPIKTLPACAMSNPSSDRTKSAVSPDTTPANCGRKAAQGQQKPAELTAKPSGRAA